MAEALRTNNTLEVLNIPAQNFTEEQAKFFLEPLKLIQPWSSSELACKVLRKTQK